MRFKKAVLLDDVTQETCKNIKLGQYIKLEHCTGVTGRFIGFTPSGAVRIIWKNKGSYHKLQKTIEAYKRMCNRKSKPVQMSLEF